MASESSRDSLPFEPGKRKGKPDFSGAKPKVIAKDNGVKADKSKKRSNSRQAKDAAIPEVVSRRMLKRMVFFSGVPTFAGVATFFVSYFVLINGVVELPSYFVLFATLGCFGLGVLGLSYGALSASWDEDRLGNWFGLDEFKVNFGRLTGSWGSKADS